MALKVVGCMIGFLAILIRLGMAAGVVHQAARPTGAAAGAGLSLKTFAAVPSGVTGQNSSLRVTPAALSGVPAKAPGFRIG